MKHFLRYLVISLLIGFVGESNLYSAHIVGGDIAYECLGNNEYLIRLKVYRDCFSTGADFDAPASFAIYDQNGSLIDRFEAFMQTRINVPPAISNPCVNVSNINVVCVEEGMYEFVGQIPTGSGAVTIAYQRCCRNSTISNLLFPGSQGATYVAIIPDQSVVLCNSSPDFNQFPPIVICVGEELRFDHSATDNDGDVLVYEICRPFSGADTITPMPFTAPPPPYDSIIYTGGFTALNPMSSSPPMAIDPNTGLLTVTPTSQGQYVVGVCVKEYRNGIYIGQTKRDFQFNVVPCSPRVPLADLSILNPGQGAIGVENAIIWNCENFTLNFDNQSTDGTFWHWDFGVPGTVSDTSNLYEPTFIYPDTGNYIVTLIVNPGLHCADTTIATVKVFPGFDPAFNVTEACLGDSLFFTDLSVTDYGVLESWLWDFRNGDTSHAENPAYSYPAAGIYPVELTVTSDKGCKETIVKNVTAHPLPIADIGFSPTCINTPVNFFDQSTILFGSLTNWQWDVNGNFFSTNQNPTNTFIALGNYDVQLIVSSDFGCKDTITQTITVYPLPVVTTNNDTIICFGDEIILTATGGDTYQWNPLNGIVSPNSSTSIAQPDLTTNYIVTVTDSNQCSDTGSVFVDVRPLPLTDAGVDTFVCSSDSYVLQGSGGVNFSWQPASLINNPNIAKPDITPSDTTTYYLTSISIDGCVNYDSVTINVQFPITIIGESDFTICRNENAQLNVSGGLYYNWSPAEGLNDSSINNPTASPDSTTTYIVTVANDCYFDELQVEVVVNQLPFVDAGKGDTIYRDEIAYLEGFGGIEYEWEPPHGLSSNIILDPDASPFNTTEYTLTVTDINGCKNSDSVLVVVNVLNTLIVPSAFSPNGDGHNDVFRIILYLNIEKLYEFSIFSRWGQKIFETSNLNGGWNGFVNDKPAELGTYVYLIKALNKDGEDITRKGTVTLVR